MCNPTLADIEIGGNSSAELSTEPLLKRTHPPSSSSSPSKTRGNNNGTPNNKSADTGAGAALLDNLPPTQQMILLSFLMFLFFGMHNILQEAIVNLLAVTNSTTKNAEAEGSNINTMKANGTIMLGYAEVIGVLVFSYLERVHLTNEGGLTRVAPLRAYPLLTMCLFASSSLSNLSLSYINFPTKVGKLFKCREIDMNGTVWLNTGVHDVCHVCSAPNCIFHSTLTKCLSLSFQHSVSIVQARPNNDHRHHRKSTSLPLLRIRLRPQHLRGTRPLRRRRLLPRSAPPRSHRIAVGVRERRRRCHTAQCTRAPFQGWKFAIGSNRV
mmetsp:Transcript_16040/g.33924  ORF Transcript_16040/g.33924 Transcript_16040/m.33924 type:complete len:325 (-) Transcript_16040:655-1629(-)